MPLPAQITTNLFPDFKNSSIGPFAKLTRITQEAGSSGAAVGTVAQEKVAQSIIPTEAGELVSVDFSLSKTGTPSDGLRVNLCADNAGEPGTVLATSITLPAASIATAEGYRKFSFFVPATLQTSTTYWLLVERTGSPDASNFYNLWGNTSNVYADGLLKRLIVSGWTSSGTIDAKFKITIRASIARYQPVVDKTNNKVRMFKSTDGGNTWSEQDSANAPTLSSTANLKSMSAQLVDTKILIFSITSGTRFDTWFYNTGTDQWDGTVVAGDASTTINTSVSGTVPILGVHRPSGAWLYLGAYNGATEAVMGSPRRRMKLSRFLSAAWSSAEVDIVGSANTPDATLPGTAVDYDLRAALLDGNEVFHMFWTQSDDSSLRHRQYNSDNTFSTANLIGSTPLTTSNSAAYSVGAGTGYFKNGEYYIALPVVESGVLKVARCLASGTATAGNWTHTAVVTATFETTNSNPAVLVADNEQGGKLFLIYTKTDGKLYYTHDQGSDSWVAEQELHPGTKTVGAISGGVMMDAIGITYLDTAPATDDLKFDSL